MSASVALLDALSAHGLTRNGPPTAVAAQSIRHLRVLVAEDEPLARLRLVRTVKRLGHEVIETADGLQAWDLFSQRGADVVITDWLMPGIDGRELCRRVRSAVASPYTYVIFSTVLNEHHHVREALATGADDYLTKPTSTEDLEACLIAAERVTALRRAWGQALAHRDALHDVARDFGADPDPEQNLSAILAEAMRVLTNSTDSR